MTNPNTLSLLPNFPSLVYAYINLICSLKLGFIELKKGENENKKKEVMV